MPQCRYHQSYSLMALATAIAIAALGWNALFADPAQSESPQRQDLRPGSRLDRG